MEIDRCMYDSEVKHHIDHMSRHPPPPQHCSCLKGTLTMQIIYCVLGGAQNMQ